MAGRMFFVANSPDEFFREFVPPEMIDSLLAISRLTSEQVDRVSTSLEEADGFLDDEHLERIVADALPDHESVNAIVSALRFVFPATIQETLDALSRWRADQGHAERFPDESFVSIQDVLPRLIRNFPALDRHRKARRLAAFTGQQFRRIDFICDVRPVFDSDRDAIEGFVTQTILRIMHEDQVGEIGEFEVVLSPEQLTRVIEGAEKARRKIAAVAELIEVWMPGRIADPVGRGQDEVGEIR